MRKWSKSILLLVVILSSQHAFAQSEEAIDLQMFRPALDTKGLITVDGSDVLGHGEMSMGLVTSWGRNVLHLEGNGNTLDVEHILSPVLLSAIGFRPLGLPLQLSVALPFVVLSGDRGPDSDGGTPANPNDDESFRFEGQGLGDAALNLKMRLRDTNRGRTGVALITGVQLPTATGGEQWLGAASSRPHLTAVIERVLGRLRVAGNAGLRLAPTQSFTDDEAESPMLPLTGATVRSGSSAPVGVGGALALVPEKTDLIAEVFGEIPFDSGAARPVEAIAGLRFYLARNSHLTIGGGSGISRGEAGSPSTRAFLGIVFEPKTGDRDGDGIADDVDGCPDNPEDFDDFEDADGCPELDNDRDGILDMDDHCPLEPEDRDGIEDEDGCPERSDFDRDGDGIIDDEDACPDDPEDRDDFEDEDGCPDLDNDGDGILDVDDLCPDDAEDFDTFEDADGCPEADNDGDRILDEDDDCPRVDGETAEETREVYNLYRDEDGCPDSGGSLRKTTTTLDILEAVHFEFDSAIIKEQSFPILRAVSMTLQTSPEILEVEVQGHTDARGSDAYNLELSQRRANAVVKFLRESGVDKTVLTPVGYGERDPLLPGTGEEVWAKNRRVEFIISRRGGE